MQNPKSLVQELLTRWRISRYESERRKGDVATRDSSEHIDRLEHGIKDVPPGGGLGGGTGGGTGGGGAF